MEGEQGDLKCAAETTSSMRLFVGGLGEKVTTDELHKIFASFGSIDSLDIIRTKGRSFAYVDFIQSSQNSLAKLLNTYNGCSWKGGRLRLEKAKEHYLTRLRREWDEDAQLANAELTATSIEVDAEKKMDPAEKARQKRSFANKQLRIFFPNLWKVKAIPFNGIGKHKYSFRRVEVPPLPTYFCDCEEHCPPHAVEVKQIPTKEEQGNGINEEELNIMNSVMNKLFQREGISEIVMDEVKPAFEDDKSVNSTNSLKFDETEGESTEEEDNLVINIVRGSETVKDTQKSRFNEKEVSKPGPRTVLKKQRQKTSQKRKISDVHEENRGNEKESSIGGEKETSQGHSRKQGTLAACQSLEPNLGRKESAPNASWSQKSSWRELLGDGGNSAFNISKVFPGISSSEKELLSDIASHSGSSKNLLVHEDHKVQQDMTGRLKEKSIYGDVPQSAGSKKNNDVGHRDRKLRKEKTDTRKEKPTSDHVSGSSGNQKSVLKHEDNEGKQGNMEAGEEPVEALASNSGTPSNNPGRGSAWLHSSSWTQLLGGSNANSFSITQVLPGVSFGKPDASKPEREKVANFTDIKYDDVAEDHKMEPIGNNSLNLGGEKKDDNYDRQITQDMGQQVVEASASLVEENHSEKTMEAYSSDITVGETCVFMRSDASLKEWANAKAAISRSRKRKSNEM